MKLGFNVAPLCAGPRTWSGLLAELPPPATLPSMIVSKLKTVTSLRWASRLMKGITGRVFGHQVPPNSTTTSFFVSVFRRYTSSG